MDTKQKKDPRTAGQRSRPAAASGASKKRTARPASEKKPAQEVPKPSADVVYLAPKPFSRNRLILHLATLTAVVIALVLGISVFFKVEVVLVSGAEKYTAAEIQKASDIEEGDYLLTFNRAQASGKIIASLPYVDSVRIGIKLPGTVNIEIVEVDVTYSVQDKNGAWWLISADGKVVESTAAPESVTQILGVQLENPQPGQAAAAWQDDTPATDAEGNVIPVTVTAAQRLTAATDIAQYLEESDVFGEVNSIDVSNLGDITLRYGQQLQVKLGGTDQLSYKIRCMKAAIDQYADISGGILDLSNPDNILYTESD